MEKEEVMQIVNEMIERTKGRIDGIEIVLISGYKTISTSQTPSIALFLGGIASLIENSLPENIDEKFIEEICEAIEDMVKSIKKKEEAKK